MLKSSQKIKTIRALGKPALTQKRLKELAAYEPETGLFKSLKCRGGLKMGDTMGSQNSDGYTLIFLDYWSHKAHRLAFLYMTGEFPADGLVVDHINHVRDDNRWSNLRLLSPQDNARHRSPAASSSTGERCVYPTPHGKYCMRLEHEGRCYQKGGFECVSDAVTERCRIEKHLFGKLVETAGAE